MHNRAAYRCRHGRRSSSPADSGLPRNVYVHERKAVTEVAAQLGLPDDPSTVSTHLREHQFNGCAEPEEIMFRRLTAL
ncbi:hypothetical protein GCM10028775_33410 [Catellatospora paridis]